MPYDDEKVKLGRTPFVKCTITMGYCSLVAGVGACTATETGDAKCFNTRASCNDPENFAGTTKDYKFCQPVANLPRGTGMFPFIKGNVQKSPTSITAGQGLGNRAVVKVQFNDGPHHDRGIDPYVDERTYDPMERGTFWGKFLTRNPYYENKKILLEYGYLTAPFSEDNFISQELDIVDMSGITNGVITVIAKDLLVRTYEQKAQYPVLSGGELFADISAVASSATLTPTGIGDEEYPASGTLSIGKEAITFTRSGDVLTFVAREQWGTTAKEHKIGDTVQICAVWNSVSIIDVLDELLVTGSGIPSSYIPTADWTVERDTWMQNSNVTGILMKPESVLKVIGELSECFMFDIWWESDTSTIRMKALSPEPPGQTINLLTEKKNIKKDSVKIARKSKDRFTEVRIAYNKADFSEKNDPEQFQTWHVSADINRASADKYGTNSIKVILCRWFDSPALASKLSGRTLARFSDTPEIITFELDQKDHGKVEVSGRVAINSWQLQDFTGGNEQREYQVIEINESKNPSHSFMVKAFSSAFSGRYWFIAPAGAPNYSAATELEKASMAFICEANGKFLDGEDGYKII
jgi:hypothetical protein